MNSIFEGMVYIFEYVDRPVLFASERDGNLVLISLFDYSSNFEKWILSPLSDDELELLKKSLIDFYSVFEKHKYDLMLIGTDNNNALYEHTPLMFLINAFKDYIPCQGVFAKDLINIDKEDICISIGN